MKIFGEDSFFNKQMATVYKAQDEYVYNEMSMAIKTYMPTVVFDREKLERWVNLCLKLDNIDNSDLIDMATQKKFAELKDQLALTEKALELACKWINDTQEMDSDCPIYADCFRVEKDCDNWDCENCDCSKFAIEHFKTKAKEMMKSE